MDALPSATGTDVANTGVTDLEAKRHMDDVGDVSDTATNAVDGDNDSTQPNVVPQESTAVDDKDSTKPDTVPQEHAADDANGPLQPAEGASVDAVRTDHEGTTYGSEVPHQPMAHDDAQEHAADDANGSLQSAEGASVDAVRTDHEGTTYGSEVPHQPMAHDDAQEHAADDANGSLQSAEGASVDAVRTDHEGTTYGSEVPHQPMAHDDVGFDTPQGQSQPQELETTMEQELESAIEELVGDINNTANTDACGVKTLVDAHRALDLQNKFGNTGVGRKDNHRQLTDK